MRIRIGLPDDRDFAGRLEVLDAGGAVMFGPVPAAGRAHDHLALAHDNASRNPHRLYGDTPLGTYAVRGVVEPGDGDHVPDGEARAAASVVLLEPATGQAAVADAHGRFRFCIQGGSGDEDLHATAGGICLRDQDHVQLVALVRRARGPVRCEIVAMHTRGPRISLARIPSDRDPPVLPGRLDVAVRPSSGSGNASSAAGAARRGAGYAPRVFVATETSGSGGGGETAYGGSAGAPGDDTGPPSGSTGTTDDPLPATGVDVAPRPGIDLNLPADQTIVRVMDTPGGLLFPAATSPSGFTPIVGVQAGGWVFSFGTQTTDPSGNTPGTGPYVPYTNTPVGPYSGTPQEGSATNQYTGTLPTEPYSNTVVPAPSSGGDQTTSAPVQRDTINNPDAAIQEMVQRFQQNDQALEAAQSGQAQAAQPQQQTAPPTITNGPPAANASAVAAQPTPQASTAAPANTSADDTTYPWTPAATSGAVSSQANLPNFEARGGVDAYARNFPNSTVQQNQWQGFLGEASFEANRPLGLPLLNDLNTRPWITASGGPGRPSFFPVFDYQGKLTGVPTSIASSSQANQANRLDFYLGKYREMVGADNPQKLNSAAANLGSTPQDLAERGRLAINADDVRAARNVIAQDIRNNPGDYRPGWSPESAADHVTSHGLTTDILGNLRASRGGLTNVPPDTIVRLASPEAIMVEGRGWGGALRTSALGGAGAGAGVSTAVNALQILANPDAHPDAARELATTAVMGGASGTTGAVIETTVNAQISRSLLSAAAGGSEVSAAAPLLGRTFAGGAGAGPAAAVFTLGEMALSDKTYTAEDYEAKGARSFVSGALSGAVSAGVVGAIWGTEVPILGNIVGFGVGFLGYLAADALFGDAVEDAVRGEGGPPRIGDFEVVQDPSGFMG